MSSMDKVLFQQLNLLSKQVADKEPFFQEIACLGVADAEIIVYCRAYKRLYPDDAAFNEFLEKQVMPLAKELGMAHWKRDVLSDLGLKLGEDKGDEDDLTEIEDT